LPGMPLFGDLDGPASAGLFAIRVCRGKSYQQAKLL